MFSNSLKTRLLSVLALVFLIAGSFLLYIDYQRAQNRIYDAMLQQSRSIKEIIKILGDVYGRGFASASEQQSIKDKSDVLVLVHKSGDLSSIFSHKFSWELSLNQLSEQQQSAESMKLSISPQGESIYLYSAPMVLNKICLKCHLDKSERNSSWQVSAADNANESVQAVINIKSSGAFLEKYIKEHLLTNAMTFLVTFLIAFLAVYSVIKDQIFNRLELLYKANKQLLSGDYSVAIKQIGNDEISHVIEGFNHMTQAISSREAKLVYSYQRTRAFFENSGEGIIIADKQGNILDINKVACEIFGFDGKLPVGRSIHELVPEHYLQRHTDAFLKSAAAPYEPLTFNGRLTAEGKHQSGHIFPIELMVTKTLHDSEPIFIGIIKDLTEVVQAEKELENAKQKYFHQEKVAVVGQMAAGILHEIGNPIASIDGSINHLKQINEEPGTHKQCAGEKQLRKENIEYLDIIAAQNHRLIELTREISNYISPQQSQRDIYDLNAILEHSRKLIRYDRRLKYINTLYNLDKNIPAIEGVQDHIAQVFLNFMINAGHAIAEKNEAQKGLIIISSGIENNEVYFSVADNGMGMSEEVQKKATDAFYTTKQMGNGTGLGLSLCNTLVKDEGGRMEIISVEGLGTEIWVYLNIAETE